MSGRNRLRIILDVQALNASKAAAKSRRDTRQSQVISEVFEQNDRPLAADEVLELGRRRLAGLGIATVYRRIKALTDEGWLVPVEMPGTSPRYEIRGKEHHHHFHCLKCGRLLELNGCLERLGNLIPSNFRVIDHVVLVYGFCGQCERGRTSRNPVAERRSLGARRSSR